MSTLLVLLVLGQASVFGATLNNSSVSLDSGTLSTIVNMTCTLQIYIRKRPPRRQPDSQRTAGLCRDQTNVSVIGQFFKDNSRPAKLKNKLRTRRTKCIRLHTATIEITGIPATEPTVDYKILCFLVDWLETDFPVQKNAALCTHITLLSFAYLDDSDSGIEIRLNENINEQLRNHILAYKNSGKLLLSLGGWSDATKNLFARVVGSLSNRRKFVEDVLQLMKQYEFDGLNLAWEYPVCRMGDCRGGNSSEKDNFSLLLEELSLALKPKGYLLTAVVSPNAEVIDVAYDVPALLRFLDWISVVSFDGHGLNYRTGHVAPLYDHPESKNDWHSVNSSISHWISKGVPSRKLVIGLPFYGRSFTLNNPGTEVGLNAPAVAMSASIDCIDRRGKLAYSEICDRIYNRDWKVVRDPLHRIGPYAYKDGEWVAFDDTDMIRRKSQYIRDMNLGGGLIFALNLDDFEGKCREGAFPLIHTLYQELTNTTDRSRFAPIESMEALNMSHSIIVENSLIFSKRLILLIFFYYLM